MINDKSWPKKEIPAKTVVPSPYSGGGGGGSRRREDEEEQRKNDEFEKDRADLKKQEEDSSASETPKENILLRDLHWENESGTIDQKHKVFASADLPQEQKDLTRIIFTLQCQDENGKWKSGASVSGHLKEGQATADLELKLPSGQVPDQKGEAHFRFLAKHRIRSRAPPLHAWYMELSLEPG